MAIAAGVVTAGLVLAPAHAQERVPAFFVGTALDAAQDERGTVVTAGVTIAVNGVGLICGNCSDPEELAAALRLTGRLITSLHRGAACPEDPLPPDDPDGIRLSGGPQGEPYRELPRGLHELETTFRPGPARAGRWVLCAWFEYGHDAGVVQRTGPFYPVEREAGTGETRPTSITIQRPMGQGAEAIDLSIAQLRINQRISQAAIRRLNALAAELEGSPVSPEGAREGSDRIALNVRQLRINQRISQAAVRRANVLADRLKGRIRSASPTGREGDEITLSASQLLINQRISQAAVRRANALQQRIPDLPDPAPGPLSPQLDDIGGFLPDGERAVMEVSRVDRRGTLGDGGPITVGDRIPVIFVGHPHLRPPFGDDAPISAIGVLHDGAMYGLYVSIEPPFDQR